MPNMMKHNIQPLLQPLTALGRRLRRHALIEGLAVLLFAVLALGIVQFGADRLLALGLGPRVVLTLLVAVGIGYVFWQRVVRPLQISTDATAMAQLVEAKHPELGDAILSAVAFAEADEINPQRNSPALVERVLSNALQRANQVDTDGILRADRHRQFLALLLTALVSFAIITVAVPDTLAAYLQRNWLLRDAPWPSTARIVAEGFTDGKLVWPLGDELTLMATALDAVPDGLVAEIESDSGGTISRSMDRRGERQFILDYGTLGGPLRLRFRIGRFGVDERTRWYDIVPVNRPFVESAVVRVTPPDYAKQDAFALPAGQVAADVIRGSRVQIDATMSQQIADARFVRRGGDAPVADVEITAENRLQVEFEPARRGTFHFDVRDEAGLEDTRPVTFLFNLLADPSPKTRLTLPGLGDMVVPNARPTLEMNVQENLGLREVVLAYRVERAGNDDEEAAAAWEMMPQDEVVPYQLEYAREREWDMSDLGVAPGDRITVQLRARDYQPVVEQEAEGAVGRATEAAPNNLGESVSYTLRVVTPETLRAELGRRESEWRGEFERIVKTQRQLNLRVMELFDAASTEGLSPSVATRFSQEARTQRQIAGRARTVLRQFEQLYSELEINGLLSPTVRKRLGVGVIESLRTLISEQIPLAGDEIDRLRDGLDPERQRSVEMQVSAILARMQDILADMLKWEGYNEAVTLLQDILRLQEDVSQDTRRELERELEALFESDGPSANDGVPDDAD